MTNDALAEAAVECWLAYERSKDTSKAGWRADWRRHCELWAVITEEAKRRERMR
jgi:hypothetical protein